MIMRSMRNSAKWMMLILGIAFIAWLVLEGVQEAGLGTGDPNPVVGEVGDRQIRHAEWNLYLQERLNLAREQREGGLTDEERRQVTETAWNQLVTDLLLQKELARQGIRVTDAEVRHAFRTSPPPDLMAHPAFQTDGQFDIEKYREFFASGTVDRNLLMQIESWYRDVLPQQKLFNRISEGVFISDAELWRHWRDVRETARVRYVSLDPAAVVDETEIEVTESDVRRYYDANREEFARPASATVQVASIPLAPSPADTAEARRQAEEMYRSIQEEERTLEELIAHSADTIPADGELGVMTPREMEPALAETAFSLPLGQVSEPVLTESGFYLLRVDQRWGQDSVALGQVLVPLEISRATEDEVFELIDEVEGIALRADLPTAADSMGVRLRRDVTIRQGAEFVPGVGALGVAVDWTFDPETRAGDLSPFFDGPDAFHVFELTAREPAGIHPLSAVADLIRERLTMERKKEVATGRLAEALASLTPDEPLDRLAEEHGWTVQTSETFRRLDVVPGLGQGTEAVGAAFGLPEGGRSGVVGAGDRVAVVEVVERQEASREEFETGKESLREQLTFQRRQEYVQRWLEALREEANVRDMRDRVGRS